MQAYYLRTVLGDIPVKKLGLILPHEHLFTDLRGPDVSDYAQADPDHVATVMVPYLEMAHRVGVTVLVECSTIGVGRNIDILRKLAAQTPIHLLVPTGLYKAEFTPRIYLDQTVEEMADLWELEITKGIGISQSKAGFIKIAMSDDGPLNIEVRNLRAAARASKATGAAIASHTIGGKVAMKELDILSGEGLNLNRFIWVHADSEEDHAFHLQAASNGVYVEFDSIGNPTIDPEKTLSNIITMIDAGYAEKILLSHDSGWYQPGHPGGQPEHGIRGFTTLTEHFIPRLRAKGLNDATINLLTVENPKRAFALHLGG